MGVTVAPCSNSAPPDQQYLVGTQRAPALHRSPLQGYMQAHRQAQYLGSISQSMICDWQCFMPAQADVACVHAGQADVAGMHIRITVPV